MVVGVPRRLSSIIAVKKGGIRKQTSAKSPVPSIVSNSRMLRVPSPLVRSELQLKTGKYYDQE